MGLRVFFSKQIRGRILFRLKKRAKTFFRIKTERTTLGFHRQQNQNKTKPRGSMRFHVRLNQWIKSPLRWGQMRLYFATIFGRQEDVIRLHKHLTRDTVMWCLVLLKNVNEAMEQSAYKYQPLDPGMYYEKVHLLSMALETCATISQFSQPSSLYPRGCTIPE